MATVQLALERFRDFLHARSLRVTAVREDIVKAALARRGHFDIDALVRDLRARGVDASRATAYRALPLLKEAGIIQETVASGGRQCYEAVAGHEHHDHLVCTRCGRVVEFQFEAFEVLQREVASKYGFRLTAHSHELFGVCRTCGRKRETRT